MGRQYRRDDLPLERVSLDAITTLVKIGMNRVTYNPLEMSGIYCTSVLYRGIRIFRLKYGDNTVK